ncbi:hypothetical protein N7448_002447 [Penicillium atrosanguineum]|nr:hypothetical protein N7448_002447 [Penicillium atrosanguineum]
MVELQSIFKKAYWTLAAGGLIYVLFVCSLTWPEVNPSLWQDVNQVEQFGFLKSQVQPFHLVTPDNETLYGWHLMPLHLCHEHEQDLIDNPPRWPCQGLYTDFHGNAAHLGSAQRPATYNAMLSLSTPSNPVHVFAIDYRGFGVSTGSPTEEGLITDGVSLINFLTAGPLEVPTSRIVIMGQSLGTAVTAAVVERYTFGSPNPTAIQPAIKNPEPFAGVILVASFSNVRNVIESYSIKGLTPPMLSPLIGYPRFQNWVMSHIVDRWETGVRLARLTGVNVTSLDGSEVDHSHKDLDLTIIHSSNDIEIPWYEGRRNWAAATGEGIKGAPGALAYERTDVGKPVGEVKIWVNKITGDDGSTALKKVRWERVRYGGHDRVATFSVAGLAALRAFEE